MRTRAEIDSDFSPRQLLSESKSLFFLGMGGAGMAPLARMMRQAGVRVFGADATESPEVGRLRSEGFLVNVGDAATLPDDVDALIISDAIDLVVDPYVRQARERGLRLFRRSQALGWLLEGKKTIAVAGTHGKTTTTGFVGLSLIRAGLDPTVVVGAHIEDFRGSVVEGKGEWAVIEACEAYDALRDFDPYYVILTNLEPDHLDFHGSEAELMATVERFLMRIHPDGALIYCSDDPGAQQMATRIAEQRKVIPYAATDSLLEGLTLPGDHNRLNAEAARVLARHIGADRDKVEAALKEFRGAERRLQVLHSGEITVIDDYAHMPAEITASIQALRERYPDQRLVVAYQPHLYSRTRDCLPELARALSAADLVFITDIYPAREAPMPGVSSSLIAEQLTCNFFYVPQRRLLPREVKKATQTGDVVVGMGAGTISEFGPDLILELHRTQKKVAVIKGGDSAEREVSLHSGASIAAALRLKGFEVQELDISELLLSGNALASLTGPSRPSVAFLAVHGNRAEDGAIQGLCELLHLPYTGSDIQTSAIAMDKALTKQILGLAGLPFPEGVMVESVEQAQEFLESVQGDFIVKPNAQGSTVGLSFCDQKEDVIDAVEKALRYDSKVLIEEWVRGTEISVPVLAGKALPVVEIAPVSGQYDFKNKYTPGATDEICPARLSEEMTAKVQSYALKAHQLLGCRGASRTDMIVTEDRVVLLEVNTLPGMTPTSLLPRSAEVAGIPFDELCVLILNDAQG